VKLFLNLIKHHTMKIYGGMKAQHNALIALVLDGGEWSASYCSSFTPWYPSDGRLGGPES
jgi:hypothetical protein